MDPIERLIAMLNCSQKQYRHHSVLDKSEVDAWNEIESITSKLNLEFDKVMCMRDKFWADVKLKHNVCDRDCQIDKNTSSLELRSMSSADDVVVGRSLLRRLLERCDMHSEQCHWEGSGRPAGHIYPLMEALWQMVSREPNAGSANGSTDAEATSSPGSSTP